MDGSQLGDRGRAAQIARRHLAKEVSFEAVAEKLRDSGDPAIEELFDLIEHEPGVGGFFGVSVSKHQEHMRDIERVLLYIECGQSDTR